MLRHAFIQLREKCIIFLWHTFFDVILIVGLKLSTKDILLLNTKNKNILRLNQIRHSQLSFSALEVLPNIINRIIVTFESRFVSFLNQAHPLTTQMHQLQLLPGIGQKRMWSIIEARKKAPFTSFTDFTKRTAISDPISLFSSRILLELESSPKYSLFTKKKQSFD